MPDWIQNNKPPTKYNEHIKIIENCLRSLVFFKTGYASNTLVRVVSTLAIYFIVNSSFIYLIYEIKFEQLLTDESIPRRISIKKNIIDQNGAPAIVVTK